MRQTWNSLEWVSLRMLGHRAVVVDEREDLGRALGEDFALVELADRHRMHRVRWRHGAADPLPLVEALHALEDEPVTSRAIGTMSRGRQLRLSTKRNSPSRQQKTS